MKVQPADSTTFRIYKGSKIRTYGRYSWGFYKDKKIEIYDAYNFNQKLIYVSDRFKNFIKSKLTYWVDGVKRITTAEGRMR